EPPKAKTKKGPIVANFKTGAKKITVDRFEPAGSGPYPAVILLHDSAGLATTPRLIFRECCQMLANEGYVVLLVHYFNSTGHKKVEKEDVTKQVFQTWMATVRGALEHARELSIVDAKRIGLIGFSVGGHLALSVAMRKELNITCVAELFGSLPDPLWKDLKYLPPTLIVHGAKDSI